MSKKTTGILVGIALGIIPVINLIASTTYAWAKRKYVPAAILSVLLATCVGSMFSGKTDGLAASRYLLLVSEKLSKEVISYINTAENIDAITLDSAVQIGMQHTSAYFSAKEPQVSNFFRHAADKTFTPAEQQAYSDYLSTLYRLSENGSNNLREQVAAASSIFVHNYWLEENNEMVPAALIAFMLTWVAGFIFCVVLFKNLYTTPQPAAIEIVQVVTDKNI